MKYRREIDGLRAVAVVPVILFHAGFAPFAGGFVGVDVFFVISGYLITSILIEDLEAGTFSLVRFYERRARRILPALFFMMISCLPFAWAWMLPSQFQNFSQALLAVSLFVSNILFWRKSDYFAPAAEENPLLHTWSLAVEEQFYVVFPILLWLLWRYGRRKVFWVILALCVISLGLSEWGWRNRPAANFYLIATRAWELGAGSMCAFVLHSRSVRENTILSMLGLGLIVLSVFAYDESTPFPSLYALAPVGGTALIILFASPGTLVGQLLSLRALVGIGLISYSAYLWHQPLFAFARIRSLSHIEGWLMLVLALASLGLGWLSWRYVERPFRHGSGMLPRQTDVFAASGIAGAVFITIGLAGHVGEGFEWRISEDVMRFVDAEQDRAADVCNFSIYRPADSHPQQQCMPGYSSEADVMFVGDSHMLALADGMREALEREAIDYYFISHTSCMPLLGFVMYDGLEKYDCENFLKEAYGWAQHSGVDTIVLAARFPLYLRGSRFDNHEGGVETGACGFVDLTAEQGSCDDEDRQRRVLKAYEAEIRKLAQSFDVVLVYPIPEAGWHVPRYSFRKATFGGYDEALTTSYDVYKERTQEVNDLFDRIVEDLPNVFGARVHEALCRKETARCMNYDKNGVYYYDDDHLSNAGARLVAPPILEAVQIALER